MNLATVHSFANIGVDAPTVVVEAHLSNGLPQFTIVGLPETTVKEARDRVRSAIINSGFTFPVRRITVNLAPADVPKHGGRFDLPIAIGILVASGQLPKDAADKYAFVGELALSGALRPTNSTLPAAISCKDSGRYLITAADSPDSLNFCQDHPIYVADSLPAVCTQLAGGDILPTAQQVMPPLRSSQHDGVLNLRDVRGQPRARRALEIAAAGRHNLLFSGPPGSGKSMLAQRLPGILPTLDYHEGLQVASLYSVVGKPREDFFTAPFRAPHHSASAPALVGGGSPPMPGEISLAHCGVLFMDELPEYSQHVLELLREPIESGQITISRAKYKVDYQCRFQLVAAMNPCPCGFLGDAIGKCRCTPSQIKRYQSRLSGPLLDRLDISAQVSRPKRGSLTADTSGEGDDSATVRKRILVARKQQMERQGMVNAALAGKALQTHVALDAPLREFMELALQRLGLSARGYHRTLRVARTIADMAMDERVGRQHLEEALSYRQMMTVS